MSMKPVYSEMSSVLAILCQQQQQQVTVLKKPSSLAPKAKRMWPSRMMVAISLTTEVIRIYFLKTFHVCKMLGDSIKRISELFDLLLVLEERKTRNICSKVHANQS